MSGFERKRCDTEDSSGSIHPPKRKGALGGLSRRSLVLGAGVLSSAGFLCPAVGARQIDVPPLDIDLADQFRATATLSSLLHWGAALDVSERFAARDKPQGDDFATLKRITTYLIDSLKPRTADILWITELALRQAEPFQQTTLAAMKQLPLEEKQKAQAVAALTAQDLLKQAAVRRDVAPKVADGIGVLLKQSAEKSGVPQISDKSLRSQWMCIVLHAMLSSAVASAQWQMLASITLQMQTVGCMER